ncbi:MAG TPA: right-handed parallel beta-helix repeat-containing protein, partial [Alphaproteobacteria bacterium]
MSELERAKRAADAAEAARAAAEAALVRALESAAAIERIRGELEAEQRARSIEVRPPLAPEPATPRAAPAPAAVAPAPSAVPPRPSGVVHHVGPDRALKRPSEAARIAQPGDTVEIDAGTYEGDVAVWTQRGVTIRGVGGRVVLKAAGVAAEDRAIWIVRGAGVTVESIDFSGVSVPDSNGAGLSGEAGGLTIRRCRFYDNQIGVAVGDFDGDVLIEESEFFNNTVDHRETGAVGHNVSIGRVASFTLRNSFVHRARTSDNVRSRARANFILANRIVDERDGAAGTAIDVAEGHLAYIVGNVLHKGARGESQVVVSFASEAHSGEDRLYVVNNTIVTETPAGAFVRNGSALPALVANNVLVGSAVALDGPGRLVGNLLVGTADTRGGLGRLFDTFRRYV